MSSIPSSLVLLFGTTLTYATSFVVGVEPALTRPRSSGTLSREGRGLWLDRRIRIESSNLSPGGRGLWLARRIGIESSNPLPWRERVVARWKDRNRIV